jgi:hypothetical protein
LIRDNEAKICDAAFKLGYQVASTSSARRNYKATLWSPRDVPSGMSFGVLQMLLFSSSPFSPLLSVAFSRSQQEPSDPDRKTFSKTVFFNTIYLLEMYTCCNTV